MNHFGSILASLSILAIACAAKQKASYGIYLIKFGINKQVIKIFISSTKRVFSIAD